MRVEQRSVCGDAFSGIDHRGQPFVVHQDLVHPVSRRRRTFSDHDGHRLTHVGRLVLGQNRMGRRVHLIGIRICAGRQILDDAREVGSGEHRRHSRNAGCLGGINSSNPGMGMGAAQHQRVQHTRQLQVVNVGTGACQQPLVLKPYQRLACIRHFRPPLTSPGLAELGTVHHLTGDCLGGLPA